MPVALVLDLGPGHALVPLRVAGVRQHLPAVEQVEYARSSLRWQLSLASPVSTARSMGAPDSGAARISRTARTMAAAW
jgi:hypothetical protein